MPRTAQTPLRCAICGRQEDPTDPTVGPRATGAENRRDGRPAYHIRCACGHDWWSVTPRARLLSKTRDEEAVQAADPAVTVPTDSEGDEG